MCGQLNDIIARIEHLADQNDSHKSRGFHLNLEEEYTDIILWLDTGYDLITQHLYHTGVYLIYFHAIVKLIVS